MTSGSRGIHVVAPLRRGPDSNTVRTRAGELAEEVAGRLPDQLTTSWRKEGRGGRVLVDAARNTYAQTAVAPYAVRAKPGAPVATPLFWDEVADCRAAGLDAARRARAAGGARRSVGGDRSAAASLPANVNGPTQPQLTFRAAPPAAARRARRRRAGGRAPARA